MSLARSTRAGLAALCCGLLLALALRPAFAASGADLAALEQLSRTRQAEAVARLQTALPELPADGADTFEALRLLGSLQAQKGLTDETGRVLGRLEQLARESALPMLRRDAAVAVACLQAQLLQHGGPLTRADGVLQERLVQLDAQSSSRLRQHCLSVHAAVKESLGHYEQAVRLYQEAIRVVDEHGPAWRRSELRGSLANVLRRAGQQEQARGMIEQALHLAREQDDPLGQSKALTVKSIIISGHESLAEEQRVLQAALDLARQAGASFEEAQCLANLSDYHLQRAEHERALLLANQALPLARQTRNYVAEGVALVNGGLALISLHRKDEGLRRVRESVDRDLRADDVVGAAESLVDLGRYLEQAGYPAEAYAALQEQRRLADEVARRSQQRDIAALQAGFEADRRQHERTLLLEDGEIKEEQFRQQDLRYRFWFMLVGAGGLLVLLAALMYRRVRAAQAVLHRSTERLRSESWQDGLTSLANRRHFHALHGEATEARGALFLLDLDHFKQINDRHGHAGGDAVLVEVARRLRAVTREDDLVVRWGGEEFLIVTPAADGDQLDALAQRLLNALAALPVLHEGRSIPVTGSIGYAGFPLQPGQLELPWTLAVDLVDDAMYLAKTQGRNRACGVRRVPATDLAGLQALMQDLEAAWRDGRVQLTELRGPAPAGGEA